LPPDQPEPVKSGGGWFSGLFGGGSTKAASRSLSEKQEKQVRKLLGDYESKRDKIIEKWKQVGEDVTPLQVKPRKTDVRVTHFGLGWAPCYCVTGRGGKVELIPAYQ
jgi:hypothetical protein